MSDPFEGTSQSFSLFRAPIPKLYRGLIGKIILLEGNIGAGKSTLGEKLTRRLKDLGLKASFIREEVSQTLLAQFIADPKKYAYSFQLVMLKSRVETYRRALIYTEMGRTVIIDRGMYGDYCFSSQHHESGNITDEDWECYRKYFTEQLMPSPDFVLYLSTSPQCSMRRILKRSNDAEKAYDLAYLEAIDRRHRELFEHSKGIITIDWDKDCDVDSRIPEVLDLLTRPLFLPDETDNLDRRVDGQSDPRVFTGVVTRG